MGNRSYRNRSVPSVPPPTTKKQVLGYVRVSSDMQADEGHSLSSQEARIEEWCRRELGEGNYVLQIEKDEGLSGSLPYEPPRPGSTKYRPGLGRAVERLRTGEVDYFVVYRLNRIFRNFRHQLNFFADFFDENEALGLVTLAESVDLKTMVGGLQVNLLGAISDYERKQISQNLKDANRSRRKEGYPTGHPPYGWRRTPGGPGVRSGIAPHPEELQWVKRCFELSLAGKGVREIGREMQRLGAPPPGRTGRWDELKVYRMLQQPFHAGLIWDGEETRQGIHWEHRVIEPEEFEQVQRGLEARKRERVPYEGRGLRPLYNVGRCGTCGARLRVVDVDGEVVYRCPGSAAQGELLPPDEWGRAAGTVPPEGTGQPEGAMAAEEASQPEELEGSRGDTLGSGSESEDSPAWCPGWQKVADHVDELLLRLLSTAVTLPEFTALAEEEARKLLVQEGREGLRERQRRLQRRLAETKEQRRRLVDVYELGKLPLDEYVTRYDGIHARLQETEAELANVERRLSGQESDAALLQRIRELLTEVPVVWAALAPDERRQLVADLTEYVVVERTGYRQSRLRVKVHFLPEQSGLLPHAHSLNGGYAVGVDGLTERELALLYWLGQGRGIKEIAAHWNADSTGVYRLTRRIRERLQVETLEEAVALAWIRVQAEKERLPLDVATQRGLQPWRHSQASRMAHILEGYRRGLDRKAIAAEMGMALQSIRHYEWKACKQYGVKSLTEAVERFVEAQGITSEADGGAGA